MTPIYIYTCYICNMGRSVCPCARAYISGKSQLHMLHVLCNTMATLQHYGNNIVWINPQCITTITTMHHHYIYVLANVPALLCRKAAIANHAMQAVV